MLVLEEHATEATAPSYVEVGQIVRIDELRGQRVSRARRCGVTPDGYTGVGAIGFGQASSG
jgi:hypothetical protein